MKNSNRLVRRYDHRLRDLVRSTGDIKHATRLGVPGSTARGWLRSEINPVITCDVVTMESKDLQREVARLRKRVAVLAAVLRVVLAMLRVSGASLENARLPDGAQKRRLLRAVERSSSALPLRSVLRILGLSSSRFYAWKREGECGLDDVPSCPRTSPHQMSSAEVETIKEMVTSPDYRHVPTGTLAILAQRLGRVFASPTTWYRLVRKFKWRRPRRRIHPAKPKVGIRATKPNEIWHVDMTMLRLLDGSRAYLHAIIDNFSRRILSWKVSSTFDPDSTAELLIAAATEVQGGTPTLLADGGIENFNSSVDRLVDSGLLNRLLAMTDILFSNSLIESWWRILKNHWLYLNTLDSVSAVEKLVDFYVGEHNSRLPHSAFRGQTPDEMYFGTGDAVPEELAGAKVDARHKRMEVNRALACGACDPDLN